VEPRFGGERFEPGITYEPGMHHKSHIDRALELSNGRLRCTNARVRPRNMKDRFRIGIPWRKIVEKASALLEPAFENERQHGLE
jgi:hypothetical protein